MPNVNFWLDAMDDNAGRFILPEKWKDDTVKYIDALKAKSPNKQTKSFLDGLKKHLGDNGFLSDEQKNALANITQGTKGDSTKDGGKEKVDAKDTSSDARDTSKEKPEKETEKEKTTKDDKKEVKKKIPSEAKKEIKKQLGAMLSKIGGVSKEMASKVDSQAVDAIDKGVAGGQNVGDATKSVMDKIKEDLLKRKEEKELAKKKKAEAKKQEKAKKTKKESFGIRFKDYLK